MSSSTTPTDSYVIRPYKQSDIPELEELETVTFLDNPLMNYMGGVQKALTNEPTDPGRQALKGFQSFMTQNVILNGGHIDVIVDPTPADGSGKEKVIGAALWFAPGKHLSPTQVFTMFKAGLVGVLRRWGVGALPKIPEFSDQAAKVAKDGFKAKGLTTSPKQVWYLQIISVSPEYQGKGLSSRLVRHFFTQHAEEKVFTLEATTHDAMLRYGHIGFENLGEIVVGKGSVLATGLPPTAEEKKEGKEVGGVTAWSMVYVKKD